MLRLRFSTRSCADPADIWARIAPDSQRNAETVHERLFEKCAQLMTQPRSGHRRDEVKPGLRCVNSDGYAIFYRINKTEIGVSRIIHHSRNLSKISFDLT